MLSPLTTLREINRLDPTQKKVLFFLEQDSDWPFLKLIYNRLLDLNETPIVISEKGNLDSSVKQQVFSIPRGFWQSIVLSNLEVRNIITTTTGFGSHHFPRTKNNYTRYHYVFHSLASIFGVYRKDSFTYYDFIYSPTTYISKELLTYKKFNKSARFKVSAYGYEKIEILKNFSEEFNSKNRVLIAPTWGDAMIDFLTIRELVETLARKSIEVTVRLHPMTIRKNSKELKKFYKEINGISPGTISNDYMNILGLKQYELLITDWSGTLFDFSIGMSKPVISINTHQKIYNSTLEYDASSLMEYKIRSSVGDILQPRASKFYFERDFESSIKNLLFNSERRSLIQKYTSNFYDDHLYKCVKNIDNLIDNLEL